MKSRVFLLLGLVFAVAIVGYLRQGAEPLRQEIDTPNPPVTTVGGLVLDPESLPVAGATVCLLVSGKVVQETLSGPSGEFGFDLTRLNRATQMQVTCDHDVWGELKVDVASATMLVRLEYTFSSTVDVYVQGTGLTGEAELVTLQSAGQIIASEIPVAFTEGADAEALSLSEPSDLHASTARFTGVPLGRSELLAESSAGRGVETILVKKNGSHTAISIELTNEDDQLSILQGKVYLDGRVVTNAEVSWRCTWPSGLVGSGFLETNATGEYGIALRKLFPGCVFKFKYNGVESTDIWDPGFADILLDSAEMVEWELLDSVLKPLPSMEVLLQLEGEDAGLLVLTNEEGRFLLTKGAAIESARMGVWDLVGENAFDTKIACDIEEHVLFVEVPASCLRFRLIGLEKREQAAIWFLSHGGERARLPIKTQASTIFFKGDRIGGAVAFAPGGAGVLRFDSNEEPLELHLSTPLRASVPLNDNRSVEQVKVLGAFALIGGTSLSYLERHAPYLNLLAGVSADDSDELVWVRYPGLAFDALLCRIGDEFGVLGWDEALSGNAKLRSASGIHGRIVGVSGQIDVSARLQSGRVVPGYSWLGNFAVIVPRFERVVEIRASCGQESRSWRGERISQADDPTLELSW